MTLPHDTEEREAKRARAHGALRRSLFLWTPFAVASLGGAIWLVLTEITGIGGGAPELSTPSIAYFYENAGWFTPEDPPLEPQRDGFPWVFPIILFALGALFTYQVSQPMRDLRGGTLTTAGFITRHWRRLDLTSFSHYLRLDNGKLLRTDKLQYLAVDKGHYVEIEYYPASMLAVIVDRQEAPEGADLPDEPDEPNAPEPDPLLIERE